MSTYDTAVLVTQLAVSVKLPFIHTPVPMATKPNNFALKTMNLEKLSNTSHEDCLFLICPTDRNFTSLIPHDVNIHFRNVVFEKPKTVDNVQNNIYICNNTPLSRMFNSLKPNGNYMYQPL
jgi:hypothetical protein